MKNMRRLTEKELSKFVNDYDHIFEGWKKVSGCAFFRFAGPVLQTVSFENLRAGDYRPQTMTTVLIAPNSKMLHQFLDVKHRQILPREHEAMKEKVIKAMQEQFKPSILKPLDTEEILQLGEKETNNSASDYCGFAALNAYLGRKERALEWCEKVQIALNNLGRDLAAWEIRDGEFGIELKQAILAGNDMQLLERMKEINLAKYQKLIK